MATLFQGEAYASGRPTYKRSLFSTISSAALGHEKAWDVGTGNGQAAIGLADFFDQVVATDASEEQLLHADRSRVNVSYAFTSTNPSWEEVEATVGGASSVDAVVSAQAAHWLQLGSFYDLVNRLLRRPGGVVALWCYKCPHISDELVTDVMEKFYQSSLPFWEPNLQYVNEGYANLPFPFQPLAGWPSTGPFRLPEHDCVLERVPVESLLGFLRSWSAVKTARSRGVDLLNEDVQAAFTRAWDGRLLTITYPLYLLIGTLPS